MEVLLDALDRLEDVGPNLVTPQPSDHKSNAAHLSEAYKHSGSDRQHTGLLEVDDAVGELVGQLLDDEEILEEHASVRHKRLALSLALEDLFAIHLFDAIRT